MWVLFVRSTRSPPPRLPAAASRSVPAGGRGEEACRARRGEHGLAGLGGLLGLHCLLVPFPGPLPALQPWGFSHRPQGLMAARSTGLEGALAGLGLCPHTGLLSGVRPHELDLLGLPELRGAGLCLGPAR